MCGVVWCGVVWFGVCTGRGRSDERERERDIIFCILVYYVFIPGVGVEFYVLICLFLVVIPVRYYVVSPRRRKSAVTESCYPA